MAFIVLNTVGSTGDLFPFIALGQGLKARGHRVLFAANTAMQPVIEKAGLETVSCGTPLWEEEARKMVEFFDGSAPLRQLTKMAREWLIPDVPRTYRELLEICKGADALVATSIQFAAPMVCEKLGMPQVTVLLSPCQLPTAFDGPPQWPSSGPLATSAGHRFGWWIARLMVRRIFLAPLNKVRAELGFKPLSGAPTISDFSNELVLLACSRHFITSKPDWEANVKMTGFWFYDAQGQAGQPDAALEEFMRRGEKPVVLSLGSMVQKDPRRVVALHAEALARLRRRLVIQRGWANFDAGGIEHLVDSGQVFFAGFLPHDQLFPRAAAVIHHGGAGTTARALRHGCPMLLEPHGFDQPYNARHVKALGVGAELPAHKATVEGLERKLKEVLAPQVREKALGIAEKIRAEDGVGVACAQIERLLASGRAAHL